MILVKGPIIDECANLLWIESMNVKAMFKVRPNNVHYTKHNNIGEWNQWQIEKVSRVSGVVGKTQFFNI